MRRIELETEELVGYGLGGPDGNQVKKIGSTKIGFKDDTISAAPVIQDAEPAVAAP